MKRILTAVLITGFVITSYAQWFWQNPLPQGEDLYNVQCVTEDIFFAAGDKGTVIRTTNGGESWTSIPLINFENFTVNDIHFFDLYNGFITLRSPSEGIILRTTDAGENWSIIKRNTSGAYLDISFSDSNYGWISGGELLIKTTDGGETWFEADRIPAAYIISIYVIDQMNIFITVNGGKIIKSTDGGISWNTITVTVPYYPNSISFTDSIHGSIAGKTVTGNQGVIFTTTDGGSTWETTIVSTPVNDITYIDRETGVAVGWGDIYRTTDAGYNWIPQNASTNEQLKGVSFSMANTGMVAGVSGTLLKTTDGGINWINMQKGTRSDLFEVSFSDENYGTAVGRNGTILRTTNAGRIWILQPVSSDALFSSVSFPDRNNGTVVGFDGTIIHTTDGGNTWEDQSDSSIHSLLSVYFSDFQNGTAVGSMGNIIRTTNGGRTWIKQNSGTKKMLTGVYFTDRSNGMIIGANEMDGGVFLKTTDGGDTWVELNSNFSNNPADLFFSDTSNGIVIGGLGSSGIFRTSNGGHSWEHIYSNPERLNSISFADSYNGIAVGNYQVLRTTDGGLSWFEEMKIGPWLYDVCYIKPGAATAVGYSGVIIRNENIPFVSAADVSYSTPEEYLLYQNYPNPFNPTTTISYSVPEQVLVKIMVYDALGREVKTLVNEEKAPGNYSISLDATALATGIYFYHIKAGEFTETRKMLLIK